MDKILYDDETSSLRPNDKKEIYDLDLVSHMDRYWIDIRSLLEKTKN